MMVVSGFVEMSSRMRALDSFHLRRRRRLFGKSAQLEERGVLLSRCGTERLLSSARMDGGTQ